jgi:hypothetical protein
MIPDFSKKLLYYAHIHSHLSYGNIIWAPMITNVLKNKMSKLQDKIIATFDRNITRIKLNKQYKKLNILKMEDIIEYESNKFMYKFKSKALPNTVIELFENTAVQKIHDLRNAGIPRVARHKTKTYNTSFLAYANRTWMALPQKIKNSTSMLSFKNEFKKYKIETY